MAEYTGIIIPVSGKHDVPAWEDNDPHAEFTGTEHQIVNLSPSVVPEPEGAIPYSVIKSTWDSLESGLSGREIIGKLPYSVVEALYDSWSEELSGREFDAIVKDITKGFPESVFGKKMAGYCVNQKGGRITLKEPGRVVLTKGLGINPDDDAGKISVDGFYEAFIAGDYDMWYLIEARENAPSYAFSKYPDDDAISGDDLPDTKNLGFRIRRFQIRHPIY